MKSPLRGVVVRHAASSDVVVRHAASVVVFSVFSEVWW